MYVKGTWILDFVKMIRANKDKDWDRWLAPEDWEIINAQVLPSQWYPFESYERIGKAVFVEIAQSNLDITRTFGRIMMRDLLKVYKNILVEGDLAASVEKFNILRKTFFRGIESDLIFVEQGECHMVFKLMIAGIDRERASPEAFAHQLAGNLEELVEQAGGKNVSVSVKTVEDGYELSLGWE